MSKRGHIGRRWPLGNHHVLAPQGCQKPADEECAGARVSPRGGNTDHLKMRILKSDSQRECIIDVVTDVGVDDDGLRTLGRRAGVRQIELPEGQRRRAQ